MNTLKREYTNEETKINLTYDYEGQEVDIKTISALDKSLGTLKNYNIIKIVNAIRIILHNTEEKYLSLKVKNPGFTFEVVFEDQDLKLYTKKEEIDSESALETKYKDKAYFNTRVTGNKINKIMEETERKSNEPSQLDVYNFYIKCIINEIKDIKDMIRDLRSETKLAAYYNAFYQTDADMTSEETEDKLQIMMYILKTFGLVDVLYGFSTNQIGYEFFTMKFNQAFLPRSEEIRVSKERMSYIKDLNTEDIVIQNKEKIESIGKLIKESTNFDIESLIELAIILRADEQRKQAEIEARETGRQTPLENSEKLEETIKKKYPEENIKMRKQLLNSINTQFKM